LKSATGQCSRRSPYCTMKARPSLPEIKFPGFAAVEQTIVKERGCRCRILHVQSIGVPASRGEEESRRAQPQPGSRRALPCHHHFAALLQSSTAPVRGLGFIFDDVRQRGLRQNRRTDQRLDQPSKTRRLKLDTFSPSVAR
jgi:hypothetical protein